MENHPPSTTVRNSNRIRSQNPYGASLLSVCSNQLLAHSQGKIFQSLITYLARDQDLVVPNTAVKMIVTMPVSELPSPVTAHSAPASTEQPCDCTFYHSQGLACPCSLDFASKTGKRAVERLLHKSIFFQTTNVSANVVFQTEQEAARDHWKNIAMNRVIQVPAAHVEIGELLGKGGFCYVHDANLSLPECHDTMGRSSRREQEEEEERDYCVKFLKPCVMPDKRKFARGIADLAIEAHFLATLNHPHILKIRGITEGVELFQPICPKLTSQPGIQGGYFLILDKMHMTLDHKIEKSWKVCAEKYNSFFYRTTHDLRGARRRGLKMERLDVALQLAQAMQYLHQHSICYRDLKPDNIGFDKEDNLKLFDFGLAKELKPYKRHEDGTYHLTANTGSRRYMAPEVALRKRYNLSVDVFSYAILLWEICALEKPFDGYSELQHMSFVVQRGYRPKIETIKGWPESLRLLITRSWDQDMNRRPTFREIVGALVEIRNEFFMGD